MTILAIIFDLQKERAVLSKHIVQDVGDEITRDGDQGDEVALAGRFTVSDGLVHLLVTGYVTAQELGHIDQGIASIGGTMFGDAFGFVEGGPRDVFGGGQAEETGQVGAVGEARDIGQFADQGQGITDASARDSAEQSGFRAMFDELIAGGQEERLLLFEALDVIEQVVDALAEDLPLDGSSDDLPAVGDQGLGFGLAQGGAAMLGQELGESFFPGGDELIGE